jgi:DNA-binding LacI/PurR family transcriptional regulator
MDEDSPRATGTGTVTADDVAAIAGVSRWTVARAFKKDASISSRSRDKVLAAAERLGYAPDLAAASLSAERSNVVALLIDDFANPHKLVVLERVTRILRQRGWATLLVNLLDEADAPEAMLNASQRRVDAIVLLGTRFDDRIVDTALGARRVKKLIVFARQSRNPNTIAISCDDALAMNEIASHVIACRYRRPLFLAGPDTVSARLFRKESFNERWRAHAGTDPEVLHVGDYDQGLAYRTLSKALRSRERPVLPDVIVCENDALAFGAIDAIRHGLGLSVPGDIAVTGFDDIPQAALPGYDLTTYRQPISLMAEALADVLDSEGGDIADINIPGSFVVRSSG